MQPYRFVYLIIMNIIAFIVCAADKRAAVKGRWRVPEKTLFALALIGGSLGIFAGMLFLRHKIRRRRFMILVPLITALQTALVVYLLCKV